VCGNLNLASFECMLVWAWFFCISCSRESQSQLI